MSALSYIAKIFNVTLTDISKEIGVTSQTVNDWVKGKRRIPQKRLEQLINMFKLPEGYFIKDEEELNEVERLKVLLEYYKSINTFKEDQQYRYWSHQNEINHLTKKIEDKKLLLKIEKLFEGGGKIEDMNYSPNSVKNYYLIEEMANILSDSDKNREKIDQLVTLLLNEKQIRSFKIAERFMREK
ncbi:MULTISPECIES: helix-turn-helix domain-containing protein [Priestia]|uniref:helix-turn-helix domain-containing protein n=1 Tax=Priestia TaxID=2800373 RepID=UPI001C8EFBFC|nr:helix-turn-helix transcriptional regulator [Priestia aryabhattai]MBY0210633.1 helix-turn-helix transcriptional regulator [Priestia aryabhattai]